MGVDRLDHRAPPTRSLGLIMRKACRRQSDLRGLARRELWRRPDLPDRFRTVAAGRSLSFCQMGVMVLSPRLRWHPVDRDRARFTVLGVGAHDQRRSVWHLGKRDFLVVKTEILRVHRYGTT